MKFRSILYGSGKAGNIVGAKGYDGEYTIRAYVPHVNDRNSVAQQQTRSKASIVVKALAPLAPWAKKMIMRDNKRSAWNELIKMNLAECIDGTWPNYEADFTKMQVAKGPTPLPYSPSATNDSNTLSITWSDNTGMEELAKADDQVCVVAYNNTKKTVVSTTSLANRSERNGTLNLPTSWSGDTVNVFMAMLSANGTPGNSVHLATLSL